MPRIKYTGLKKDFGPLKRPWMEKPLHFKGNVSSETSKENVEALLAEFPEIFEEVTGDASKGDTRQGGSVASRPNKRKVAKKSATRLPKRRPA